MATKNPLCLYSGEIKELQSGDSLPGGSGGGPDSNAVGSTLNVATDTSYIVASYLAVNATINVDGNILVSG